jgi:hypothetical protein
MQVGVHTIWANLGMLTHKHGSYKVRVNYASKLLVRRAFQQGRLRNAGAIDEDIQWSNRLGFLHCVRSRR